MPDNIHCRKTITISPVITSKQRTVTERGEKTFLKTKETSSLKIVNFATLPAIDLLKKVKS